MQQAAPYLSIVIPVYNEAGNLEQLYARLIAVLDAFDKLYEIIFVNDGSKDASSALLVELQLRRPQQTKVIEFKRNFGQHMAIMAGFELAKGDVVVTLDADLQNPPEEIPNLVVKMEEGYDLVSGVRLNRQDNWFRRQVSVVVNKIRALITNIQMTDHGCMLRAYGRDLIDLIVASQEASVYIPALAYSYATNPTEISVQHNARSDGVSQYKLFALIRLYFDLMTGYSLVPLQIFTLLGVVISLFSVMFVVYLLWRRFFVGPEAEGVFTLFAIVFFCLGVVLMGMGIMGEYIGRIYKEVRKRPRYAIKRIIDGDK